MAQINLSTEKKIMDMENRLVVAKREGEGVVMPFAATWMELETLILSEVSQKEKDKYPVLSLISGI